jgi:hypothetical protein
MQACVFRSGAFPRSAEAGFTPAEALDDEKGGASTRMKETISEARSVVLNLTSRELIFLQKVTRGEYHFITDEEQDARLRLRDKLLEGFYDKHENRIVLNLTRDELLFLIKIARENYSFIVRTEKEARLALAAKLHKTAEAVFGVTSRDVSS